jgi:IclR family acetate operon transcriptional repressor
VSTVTPSERPEGVQSVHRALDVLEAVATHGGTLGVADIADAAAIPLPTAHRLVRTLVERGYMRQASDRRYALGPRLVPLGASAGAMAGAGAERHLAALVDELGETANLALLDGDQVVYVAQVPGRHAMRMFTEVGRRVDPHCTAVGKAMLAGVDEQRVRDVVAATGMRRRTQHTLRTPEDHLADLERVRERGYALDEEEQEVGVRCVAVAVRRSDVLMAVSVSGPAPRMSDDLVARAVPLLRRTASALAG